MYIRIDIYRYDGEVTNFIFSGCQSDYVQSARKKLSQTQKVAGQLFWMMANDKRLDWFFDPFLFVLEFLLILKFI